MEESDREGYIQRYNDRLEEYGKDPKALGWMKDRQAIRFEALAGIGDVNGSKVLDVGCGFGDLLGYFQERDITVDYYGLDINPNLIDIARDEYPGGHFRTVDFNEFDGEQTFDYVFESGMFNHEIYDGGKFIRETLAKMFDIAEKGVAADFMSTYVNYMDDNAHYTNPLGIFSYCKGLSRRVVLRHDYLPYEFCIYVYADDNITDNNEFSEI